VISPMSLERVGANQGIEHGFLIKKIFWLLTKKQILYASDFIFNPSSQPEF